MKNERVFFYLFKHEKKKIFSKREKLKKKINVTSLSNHALNNLNKNNL